MTDPGERDPKTVVQESYNRISEAYRGDSVSYQKNRLSWYNLS
jgi:hypothetical protein